MKRIFFLIVCALLSIDLFSQDSKADVSFDFPFIQGSKEWAECGSTKDRIKALQIPEDTLPLLSTNKVLELCLSFPYLLDIYGFDSLKEGFRNVFDKFNGFKELFGRADLVNAILARFNNLSDDIRIVNKKTDIEKGLFANKCLVLTYILNQQKESNLIEKTQMDSIQALVRQNALLMTNNPHIFDSSIFHLTKSLLSEKQKNTRDYPPNGEPYSDVDEFGDTVHYVFSRRQTPYQDEVLVRELVSSEFNTCQKATLRQYVESTYGVNVLGEASRRYNCHAYAWHISEGGDTVWIGTSPTDVDIYWTGGSYIEVQDQSEATKVTYTNNHSAVRVNNNTYISKWSRLPLVKHAPNNTLLNQYGDHVYGTPYKYYRRAQIHGDSNPCGSSVYYVEGLPTGYTVAWSISPAVSFFNTSILTTNSPQQNQCTITNTTVFPWSTTLFAAVKNPSGTTVATLSKCVRNTFDLTFSQSGFGSYPSIPASTVVSNGTIVVNHNCWVTLSSPYFSGMTILHTGATPQAFEMFNGDITFKFSTVTSTQNMTILGQDGCKVMQLLVQVSPNSNIPIPMLSVSPNGEGFEVELIYEGDEEDVRRLTERLQDIEWELNIAKAVSGEKVRNLRVKGPKVTVSTVGWKSGIYVLQGIVNGQECSKKVTIK